jgi:fumarate reductase flavoprotein subunit
VIALAAKWRQNSRGAHFRSDFPSPGDFTSSRFSIARQTGGKLAITDAPVTFSHVRPGEALVKEAAHCTRRSADDAPLV